MTRVRFLMDYRGKLTGEIFYQTGAEMEFDDNIAAQLVENHRAEYVVDKQTSAKAVTHKPRAKRGKEQ